MFYVLLLLLWIVQHSKDFCTLEPSNDISLYKKSLPCFFCNDNTVQVITGPLSWSHYAPGTWQYTTRTCRVSNIGHYWRNGMKNSNPSIHFHCSMFDQPRPQRTLSACNLSARLPRMNQSLPTRCPIRHTSRCTPFVWLILAISAVPPRSYSAASVVIQKRLLRAARAIVLYTAAPRCRHWLSPTTSPPSALSFRWHRRRAMLSTCAVQPPCLWVRQCCHEETATLFYTSSCIWREQK